MNARLSELAWTALVGLVGGVAIVAGLSAALLLLTEVI